MNKSVDKVNRQDPSPGEDVMDLVHTVMHQFRSRQFQVLREGHAVTHMESKVLGFFGRHPGATQSDLVQHSGRDKAQLARLIKGLKERSLLLAEPDEADRRNIRLRLSPDGDALLQALQGQARLLGTLAVQRLSADEQQQLAALLKRVKQNLDGQG